MLWIWKREPKTVLEKEYLDQVLQLTATQYGFDPSEHAWFVMAMQQLLPQWLKQGRR